MIFTLFLLTFTGNHIHFVQVIFKILQKFENFDLKITFFWKIIKAYNEGNADVSNDSKNDFHDDLKSSETETSPDIEPNPDQFSAVISGKAYFHF